MNLHTLVAPVISTTACLALAGCISVTRHSRYDEQFVAAVTRPALACDNAERCVRGMEADLLTDATLSDSDRTAVAAAIRSLRTAMLSDPRALENPANHQVESIQFAALVDSKTDEALALWKDINQRYGRVNSD